MGEDFNKLLYTLFHIVAFMVAPMGIVLFVYACCTSFK